MNSIAGGICAICLSAITSSYPQKVSAEGFTGQEFLTWSETQQRGYLEAQVVMAGTIAARINPELAQCISSEFMSKNGLSASAFSGILGSVAEYETYHPSTLLVVLIEQDCGAFD